MSKFIQRVIDWFYTPFSRFLPKEIFRYGVCGVGNMVLDWVLYFLVYNYVVDQELVYLTFLGRDWCLTPHIAALCIVFPITLLTGFWLNKYVTFTQSAMKGWVQLSRYIMVVGVNLAINYFGLKLCVETMGWWATPSKIVITLITVVVSFLGQKYFSFRR